MTLNKGTFFFGWWHGPFDSHKFVTPHDERLLVIFAEPSFFRDNGNEPEFFDTLQAKLEHITLIGLYKYNYKTIIAPLLKLYILPHCFDQILTRLEFLTKMIFVIALTKWFLTKFTTSDESLDLYKYDNFWTELQFFYDFWPTLWFFQPKFRLK